MTGALNSEKDLFNEAVEIASPAARAMFLKGACGEDEALRARVEALLEAHGGAGRFLEGEGGATSSAGDTAAIWDPASEGAGSLIGRYKLLQRIGEGGFGVVYMAEQREPVKRRVALKIIKLGMDTKQVIGRFEAERQALAMMDHPNIAKVLDGGATETGRPYFVMELVRGVPLTEFCDERHLTAMERLELFIQVCGAIQHAHQKGVIHRDIKPSNVMITMHDDQPVPKVIDFGIAKAMQQDLTDKTVFTRFHEFLGTPAYMSPEQAQLSGLDIDTRSDIYALGVLLYELLTGRTPFDTQELISGGYDEMRRRIREEEPLKPSTRLRTLRQEDRTHVARRRRTEPGQLGSLLHGDLDWIVMKAIEKNRSRRYESAGALAQDIRRFLRDEPVTAAAPSLTYKFRKFARRHRTALAMATLLAGLLVGGVVTSTYFAVRARQAEGIAREQAAIAEAVNHFLNEDLFAQADPQVEPDREIRLRTALDRAAQRIGERFRQQPLVEAEIRGTIGRAYQNLGNFEVAEPHLQLAFDLRSRELGDHHPMSIKALGELALVQNAGGHQAAARATGERAVQLALRELGRQHPLTFKTMSRLAWIHYRAGRNPEAHEWAAQAAALAPAMQAVDPEDHARVLQVLGRVLGKNQRVAEGEQRLREANRLLSEAYGAHHPATLYSRHFLAAYLYDHRRHLEEVEAIYSETLEQWRHIYGEAHDRPLIVRRNLVLLLLVQERLGEAAHHLLKLIEFFPPDRQEGDLIQLRDLLDRLPAATLDVGTRFEGSRWVTSTTAPPLDWAEPDYADGAWARGEVIGQAEQWWRQSFELEQSPDDRLFLMVRNHGDFQIFLNGLPARRESHGKLDDFQVVICDAPAQATLRRGRNVIAVHGTHLRPGEPLALQLARIPPLSEGVSP